MTTSVLSIRSSLSNRELILSLYHEERFRVELKGFEVSAIADIWAYTDANRLNNLFQELGRFNKPWQGERSWASVEGDFSLSATCTSFGSVTFHVDLCGAQGAPEEWHVQAGLVVEFGQLEQIAESANGLFSAA